MRVSTGQLQQLMMNSLQRSAVDFGNVSQQMATGKKILKPSDAPLDSIQLMGLKKEQSALKQYNSNAANVKSGLSESETYMQSISDTLLKVRDLVLEAGNGGYNIEDRTALANELRPLQEALKDSANAKNEDGHYIFSGSEVDQAPIQETAPGVYAYGGDNLSREVNVSKGVQIAGNVDVQDVFFSGAHDLMADLDAFITDLETNPAGVSITNMLNSTDAGIDMTTQTLTEIGGRIAALDQITNANTEIDLYSQTLQLELESLDYADASMRLTQAQLALQTTQQVYSKVNQLSLFSQL